MLSKTKSGFFLRHPSIWSVLLAIGLILPYFNLTIDLVVVWAHSNLHLHHSPWTKLHDKSDRAAHSNRVSIDISFHLACTLSDLSAPSAPEHWSKIQSHAQLCVLNAQVLWHSDLWPYCLARWAVYLCSTRNSFGVEWARSQIVGGDFNVRPALNPHLNVFVLYFFPLLSASEKKIMRG